MLESGLTRKSVLGFALSAFGNLNAAVSTFDFAIFVLENVALRLDFLRSDPTASYENEE
tara:strand:+ start:791 stop:967 length:177 start_codon:yes stop_codon:yes gene_type:complete